MAFARLQILPKEPLKMRCGNQHLGSKNWKFTKQQIRWFANQAVGGFTDLPTVPAASGRHGSLKTAATEFWFLWKYPAKCTIYIQYIYSIYTVYISNYGISLFWVNCHKLPHWAHKTWPTIIGIKPRKNTWTCVSSFWPPMLDGMWKNRSDLHEFMVIMEAKKRPEFINLGSHVKSKEFAELGN